MGLVQIPSGLRQIVAIGAHSDDIEIGCGGLLSRVVGRSPGVEVVWAVLCGDGTRVDEARRSAEALVPATANADLRFETYGLRDGFLEYAPDAKEALQAIGETTDPDLVLTHNRDDLHQDHQLLGRLALQAFRGHPILEYEIPKYDGDLGRPNAYFPLSAEEVDAKIAHVRTHFVSQGDKHWFDEELFRGLMRIRGAESRSPSGYAEGYFVRKLVFG